MAFYIRIHDEHWLRDNRAAIRRRIQESSTWTNGPSVTVQPRLCEEGKAWLDRPDVRRVLDVLRARARSPKSIYHPDDNLEFDLGLDSMGRVDLLVALENELGVKTDDRTIIESYTIRELVNNILKGKLSQPGSRGPQAASHPPLSAADVEFFGASRALSAPLWFAIGRGIELIGKIFFGLEVLGRENLPKSGPFIICSNHQSYLDPPFVLSVLPWSLYQNLFLVGTSELFGRGLFRALAKTLRLYPIDPDVNLLPAMRIAGYGLSRGMGLLIYPEGERSVDGEPKVFKKGAGLLAANSRVPIYPLAIDGFSEAWPRGRGFARFARLRMKFGEPVHCPANIDPQAAHEAITERVRNLIVKMKEELRSREGASGPDRWKHHAEAN